jgi:uracil-DNA glycosylase
LVLVVGGLAARRLLGLKTLDECVGGRYSLGEAVALPLPHPSGASGWLNAPQNRQRLEGALAIVGEELRRAGV